MSELETFNYLDVIQIILTLMLMYILVIYDRLVQKVVNRDDPFTNAVIFIVVIYMVIFQKYLVELACYDLFGE